MTRWLALVLLVTTLACSGDETGPMVMTAARDLPVGTVLTREMLTQTPAVAAGPSAVTPRTVNSALGRPLRVALAKGDLVHAAAFAGAPSAPLRAFTAAVTGSEGLRTGDHVDVIHLTVDPSSNEQLVTPLLDGVVILSLGPLLAAQHERERFPLRQVTFEVLPEEAEMLAFAEDTGVLQVMTRNASDPSELVEGRATITSVLTGERARVLQQKRFNTIQVIRGSGGGGSSGGSESPAAPPPRVVPLMERAVEAPRLGKVVFRNEKGEFQPLPIRALRTVVYIEGPRARTVVDFVVQNPFDRVLEGSLRYPLPQDASPAWFGSFQGVVPFDPQALAKNPKLVLPPLTNELAASASIDALTSVAPSASANWQACRPARVVEQKKAAQTYERVVRRRIDPALVEWAGANEFEARVYPIAAKSLKRVVLVYEQTLSSDGAFLHYAFPMPERAVPEFEARLLVDPSKSSVAALTVSGEDRLSAFAGKTGAFSIASLDLSGKTFKSDLRLALKPAAPSAQFLVGGNDAALPGHFVYGRLVAQVPTVAQSTPTGDALFLLDTSLSEDGDRARLAGEMLQQVLERDSTITRFNVLLFDIRGHWLFPDGLRDNTPAARQATLDQLRTLTREGATSFESALQVMEATPWLPSGATAFLLSDGQLTWGERAPARLLARHPRAAALTWVTYRFGDGAVNRALFDALTARKGQIVTCLSASQVPIAALAHRQPALRVDSVRVDGVKLHDFVVRGSPPSLAPGQEFEIAGRVLGGQGPSGEIVVEGTLDGKPLNLRWPFSSTGNDMLAGRAWAELHAERLLALQSPSLDRLIIALSQHFGMTNRLASLLVLETDAEYTQYDVQKVQVSVSELEALARSTLARAIDVPPGLETSALSASAKDFLAQLPNGAPGDALANLSLKPTAGGDVRAQAEATFRAARSKSKEALLPFHALSRARRQAGDLLGAARALSGVVELRPEDPEALRLAGFVLLADGLPQPAAELFGHLRATRSFEVQTYLEEALALIELGRIADAARNYELVLARTWERHAEAVDAAREHYVQWLRRLLGGTTLNATERQAVRRRIDSLGAVATKVDLQVTLQWNVDDVDIDLWVTGPEGERTWYQQSDTKSGGHLFWDDTTGYGPELFQQARAHAGTYVAEVHYFGNNSEQWAIPSIVLGILDRSPNDPKLHSRSFTVKLLSTQGESQAPLFRAAFR
jgi:Flp pilus assembly protein CpaB